MPVEFATNEDSLAQLRAYVLGRFKQTEAELFLTQRGGQMLSDRGDIALMLDRLSDYCGQFPLGLLRLRMDHPYGMVVMLWCHCTPESGCEIKCPDVADRPRAVLTTSGALIGDGQTSGSQAAISAVAEREMEVAVVDTASTLGD